MTEPEPTTPVEEPVPLTAETLAASGAAPVEVDVQAMMAQIQALQATVDSMRAEQGIPANPLEAAVKNLKDHLAARQAASPNFDFGEAADSAEALSDPPTKDEVQLLRDALDEVNYVEGLDYIKSLAKALYKEVVKAG